MDRRQFAKLSAGALLTSGVVEAAVAAETVDREKLLSRLRPGVFQPGLTNSLVDVSGVKVGHTTLIEGDTTRTGVSAILPHSGNLFQQKVPAAAFVGNAFGKLAGSTQVNELGTLETPIALTNTLSVSAGLDALVRYTLGQPGNEKVISVNAVVGETNDGVLNDIRALRVTPNDVLRAVSSASNTRVVQGCVGAGTGTVCFGWKGGIGSASRVLPMRFGGWTVAALLQTNFGGQLTMKGVPVGAALGKPLYPPDGSCMIVVATDAPLDHRGLMRLAKRAVFGLARTGSAYSHGSGDFAIAFTTNEGCRVPHGARGVRQTSILADDDISPLFEAALEVVEESVYASLLHAQTTRGNGNTVEALPLAELARLLTSRGLA